LEKIEPGPMASYQRTGRQRMNRKHQGKPKEDTMTENDVTGRDNFIIIEALATALAALEQLPQDRQPKSNMEDMKRLLAAYDPTPGAVSVLLAQAKARLDVETDVEEED
jgi:hypothetical protein